jgi:phage baseplate assembly protein W
MATVRLDNLIRPKQVNTQQVSVKEETFDGVVYTDLHLDLEMAVAIGTGIASGVSNDVKVSFDEEAVRNSLRNIINTKPRQKVLDPDFGTELHKFLFDPVTEVRGDAIGHYLLSKLAQFEPRIKVREIDVQVLPDDNSYYINIFYTIPSINKQSSMDVTLKSTAGSSK